MATDTGEEFQAIRQKLQTNITRTENVVSITRSSFQSDDFEMVQEMCIHLTRACDAMFGLANQLKAEQASDHAQTG